MGVTRKRIAALLVAGGLAMPLCAAEIFYMDHDLLTGKYVGDVGPLVLSGEIVPGDYDRLLAKLAQDPGRYLEQNKLLLASSEGEVAESLRIATLFKRCVRRSWWIRRPGRASVRVFSSMLRRASVRAMVRA